MTARVATSSSSSLDVFLVGVEASGDALGAELMRGLADLRKGDVSFRGLGGAGMVKSAAWRVARVHLPETTTPAVAAVERGDLVFFRSVLSAPDHFRSNSSLVDGYCLVAPPSMTTVAPVMKVAASLAR